MNANLEPSFSCKKGCGVYNLNSQCTFGAIVQLLVRICSLKLELSLQIWYHSLVVSKDVQFKT